MQRILGSELFSRAPRLSRLLQYTLDRTLRGEGKQLNQYLLAVEVFERNANYDPGADPIVRVEAARLRAKLKQYYETEGLFDRTIISYPKGGYAPTFHERENQASEFNPGSQGCAKDGRNQGKPAPAFSELLPSSSLSTDQSAPRFDNVVVVGPNRASTYVGVAYYFYLLGVDGSMPWKQMMHQAHAAVMRALAYDNTNAEAHAMLGLIRSVFSWDWSGAEEAFKRSLQLKPTYLPAHQWYGQTCLGATGRMNEALSQMRRAIRLEPRAPVTNAILTSLLLANGQYDQAIEQGWRTIEIDPNCFWAYKDMGLSFARKAKLEEAITALEKAEVLSGGDPATLGPLGYLYALSDRKSDARNLLGQLQEKSKHTYSFPYQCAFIWAGLDEWDKVFDWLNKAYDERCVWLNGVKVEPIFFSVRTEPRFTALLRKMGLQN